MSDLFYRSRLISINRSNNAKIFEAAMSSAPTNYKSALLPELVKAIKFAYPDYGVNKIHAHVVKTHLLDLKKEYDDDARPEETKGSYRDATLG